MSRREDISSVDESATKGTDSLSSRESLTPLEGELLVALKGLMTAERRAIVDETAAGAEVMAAWSLARAVAAKAEGR